MLPIDSFLNTNLITKIVSGWQFAYWWIKLLVTDSRIEYIYNPTNPGFGASHNVAIQKAELESDYHLVLNRYYLFWERNIGKTLWVYGSIWMWDMWCLKLQWISSIWYLK
jgi:GT2 family glycosyltransferase